MSNWVYVWEPSSEELGRLHMDVVSMLDAGRGEEEIAVELRRKALSPERIDALIAGAIAARTESTKAWGKRDLALGLGAFALGASAALWCLTSGNWGGIGAFSLFALIGVGIAARGFDRVRRGGRAS